MRALYWATGGVVAVLLVVAFITFGNEKESERAQEKAQELSQKLTAAGFRAPDTDILVRTLGDDGGRVCENAKDGIDGLNKAILFDQLSNGASQVGRRPIISDSRVLTGQLAILDTYCPERLEEFREELEDLEFDDVIKD